MRCSGFKYQCHSCLRFLVNMYDMRVIGLGLQRNFDADHLYMFYLHFCRMFCFAFHFLLLIPPFLRFLLCCSRQCHHGEYCSCISFTVKSERRKSLGVSKADRFTVWQCRQYNPFSCSNFILIFYHIFTLFLFILFWAFGHLRLFPSWGIPTAQESLMRAQK